MAGITETAQDGGKKKEVRGRKMCPETEDADGKHL